MTRFLVAVSGGMDSLACARFLMEEGHEVVPVHFITGYEKSPASEKIKRLETLLGLPVHLLDFSRAFKKIVIDPFIEEYACGRTPNPCLVCNPGIKFGLLFDLLDDFHCDFLATGHYARITPLEGSKKGLFKGKDLKKDQSYFLAGIPAERLERIHFPLGDWVKEDLKGKILGENLFPLTDKESQDICFLHGEAYGDFLEREGEILATPGPIVTEDGKTIGTHKGLHRYTIGQRRGLDCPGPAPYYVLRLEPAANKLVVGFKEETFAAGCAVEKINWLMPPQDAPFHAAVKIRYRHREVDARIIPEGKNGARILFAEPQSAVTPGQGAVIYEGERVLGGGIIRRMSRERSPSQLRRQPPLTRGPQHKSLPRFEEGARLAGRRETREVRPYSLDLKKDNANLGIPQSALPTAPFDKGATLQRPSLVGKGAHDKKTSLVLREVPGVPGGGPFMSG